LTAALGRADRFLFLPPFPLSPATAHLATVHVDLDLDFGLDGIAATVHRDKDLSLWLWRFSLYLCIFGIPCRSSFFSS
jgi:hypothetical protein